MTSIEGYSLALPSREDAESKLDVEVVMGLVK
jgi:hypothetical protein